MNRARLYSYFAFSAVMLWFLAAACWRLDAVFAVGGDDVGKGVLARDVVRMFFAPDSSFLYHSGQWAMKSPYVGYFLQYLGGLFLFLFSGWLGPLFAFKLAPVFLGLLMLACTAFVLGRVAGRAVALWTVFFLGTNGMYIQSVRHGFMREEVLEAALLWLGLSFLVRGTREDGRRGPVLLALFVFGLGLWAKMMFLGYIFGAVAGLLALGAFGRRLAKRLFFPSAGGAALSLSAFLAGCAPLVWYNVFHSPLGTLRKMAAPVFGAPERMQWFFANLLMRVGDVSRYAAGTLYRGDLGKNWPAALLACCALVWCAGLLLKRGAADAARRRLLVFVFVFYGLLFVLSAFVVSEYDYCHVLILAPCVELLCALFAVDLCRRFRRARLGLVLAVLLSLGWFCGQARYESARAFGRNARRAYLWNEFMAGDMVALCDGLRARGAHNLYCSFELAEPLEFFYPWLNVVTLETALNEWELMAARRICRRVGASPARWYFLSAGLASQDDGFRRICEDAGMEFKAEAEFESRAGRIEKLRLFRILRRWERGEGI